MFDQQFFASKLGHSALISVAAMASFSLYAVAQPTAHAADLQVMSVKSAELA